MLIDKMLGRIFGNDRIDRHWPMGPGMEYGLSDILEE
jgi:hypothetical protein